MKEGEGEREIGQRKVLRQHGSILVCLPKTYTKLAGISPGGSVKVLVDGRGRVILEQPED